MSQPDLVLHVDNQYISPWALCSFVALREKGVPFTLRTHDLAAAETRTSEYAALSLTERVPMLEHGGFVLTESSAIVEYVDETFEGPALMPDDPAQRARARQVMAYIRSDLAALRAQRSTEVAFLGAGYAPLDPDGRRDADRLLRLATTLLNGRDDTLFDRWSPADVDLAVMLARLERSGEPLPAPLSSYLAGQWTRPAFAEWLSLQESAS